MTSCAGSCTARHPEGYAQPLAYHPDVRRHVAEMSADLEAARLVTYRSAWLSDTQGPTPETTAALYRAKYVVGEATSRITRTALTLGGAHGIFKGSRLEQLFRDGALGPDPAAAGGFLPLQHGAVRTGPGPRRSAAADEAGLNGVPAMIRCRRGADSPGSSGGRREGSNGDRSTERARPSAISSAIASPVAGAFRMPQTLCPVAT